MYREELLTKRIWPELLEHVSTDEKQHMESLERGHQHRGMVIVATL